MNDLIVGNEYIIGTYINFTLYGFHTNNLFTVITDGRTIHQNCKYEGYDSLFSTQFGQIISDVKFFRLQ